MSRTSNDPYGDFVVRVMNSCRIALNQQGAMSHKEFETVKAIRETLVGLDRAAGAVRKAGIIIRDNPTPEPVEYETYYVPHAHTGEPVAARRPKG